MEYFTESVECLTNGAPHHDEAQKFYDFVKEWSPQYYTHFTRCYITADLFQKTEMLKSNPAFRMKEYRNLLKGELALLRSMALSTDFYKEKLVSVSQRSNDDDRKFTQSHYGNLFRAFSEYHYYEEPSELLGTRLKRNEIDLVNVSNKIALDDGCGGGRYTVALKKLGFAEVHGVDYRPINIETAKQRAEQKKLTGLQYFEGDVLHLPFADNTYDFVFCNGVIHHSRSIPDGLKEMIRVMKPGGMGWLYVINKPGGIHWDTVELLRHVMRPVSQEYARMVLRLMGIPDNRVFHILDHIMVPVNTLSSIEEIESMLHDNNIKEFRRLERGTDFDLTERLYQLKKANHNDPEVMWKYGPGELRYLFKKPE